MSTEQLAQHTPGPWINDGQNDYGVYAQGGTCLVARVYDTNTNGQAIRNAQLIAAAPELLAACNLAASKCNLCKGTGKFKQYRSGEREPHLMDCDICAPYRSAITKATPGADTRQMKGK